MSSAHGAGRAVRALIAVVALGLVAACGGDDAGGDDRSLPAVDQIAVAMAEVDRVLGGPQEYFEVNADARLVNLFVATDGATSVTPYLWLDGELQPPAPAREVGGGVTFTAAEVDVDASIVLDQVADELPTSELATFVVFAGPDGDVRYEIVARSPQGGTLAVEVTATGAVIGVETQ